MKRVCAMLAGVVLMAAPAFAQSYSQRFFAEELMPGQYGAMARQEILDSFVFPQPPCETPDLAKITFVGRDEVEEDEAKLKKWGQLQAEDKLYAERYGVEGCGDPRLFNVLIRLEVSEATPVFGFPGSTRTFIMDQPDYAALVMLEAIREEEACTDVTQFGVINTRDDGDVPVSDFGGAQDVPLASAWRETWWVALCGKLHVMPMLFAIDSKDGLRAKVDRSAS